MKKRRKMKNSLLKAGMSVLLSFAMIASTGYSGLSVYYEQMDLADDNKNISNETDNEIVRADTVGYDTSDDIVSAGVQAIGLVAVFIEKFP